VYVDKTFIFQIYNVWLLNFCGIWTLVEKWRHFVFSKKVFVLKG